MLILRRASVFLAHVTATSMSFAVGWLLASGDSPLLAAVSSGASYMLTALVATLILRVLEVSEPKTLLFSVMLGALSLVTNLTAAHWQLFF